MIRNKNRKAKVYISIQIVKGFSELIKNQLSLLKEKEINLKIKHTIPEYTTKVEILLSLNVEWANLKYYKKLLMGKAKYLE